MKKIYVSGLVFTTRVDLPTLERVHVLLSNFCGDNGFVYILITGIIQYAKCIQYTPSTRKILIKKVNIGLVSSGFEGLRENRLNYVNNPLIGYLNINSLRNKIVNLREMIFELLLDYLVLSETKIDQSFPTAQFHIKGYEVRARRDRDKHEGGLMEFVKNGFFSKRLKEYETKQSKSICSAFTIANKKWICLNIYRAPTPNNMDIFFDEITASLRKAAIKYENIIIMGDFNVDIKNKGLGYCKFDTFATFSTLQT